jgi:Type II secretion system (T2SS), protein E, N-terminal domain
MSSDIPAEEIGQTLQTIEMFEVITQANPHDCQSLEILKDAYWKVGRQKEALEVTRRLADTYVQLGQYASALLEYEGILQKEPDSPEILALLGEVESRLHQAPQKSTGTGTGATIRVDFGADTTDPTLITTQATRKEDEAERSVRLNAGNDGNDSLAKFLIQHRLAPEDIIKTALERVTAANRALTENVIAMSLIDEISKSSEVNLEMLLCGILDRSKFAFVPLDYYDVDRQVVRMLPENLTLARLIVPFDLISRTVLIAMANPFDAQGKETVQQLLDYNVQWHVAPPQSIFKVLQDVYKVDVAH